MIGELPDYITGTGFHVSPIVGLLTPDFTLHPDPSDCLLYTSDAADEGLGVDLGGRRIIKKKIYNATSGSVN